MLLKYIIGTTQNKGDRGFVLLPMPASFLSDHWILMNKY